MRVAVGVSCKLAFCSGSWFKNEAAGADCVARERAIASSEHVVKSLSGNSENPSSSEVLMRMKRTKKTFPAPLERFILRRGVRSDARPNRYHSKHNSAAYW
ncbi:hypothetical protein PHMEG_00026434 [Phytophthora megakarya]|uniref:Uncharacterized protein n=1 Tax=Phytophthora megakarya TaxID=4795 RepID=A0A225V9R1_9STRA|nr:hypothetical protein PHMEG_00026434 [Phytophthora megakarya]